MIGNGLSRLHRNRYPIKQALSVGSSMSISLHATTQARRPLALTAVGFPSIPKITLWATTAIHLDTLKSKDLRPFFTG